MANHESFKKKNLDKKDYAGKETGAKVVEGVGLAAVLVAVVPKVIKGVVSVAKKVIFKA